MTLCTKCHLGAEGINLAFTLKSGQLSGHVELDCAVTVSKAWVHPNW